MEVKTHEKEGECRERDGFKKGKGDEMKERNITSKSTKGKEQGTEK